MPAGEWEAHLHATCLQVSCCLSHSDRCLKQRQSCLLDSHTSLLALPRPPDQLQGSNEFLAGEGARGLRAVQHMCFSSPCICCNNSFVVPATWRCTASKASPSHHSCHPPHAAMSIAHRRWLPSYGQGGEWCKCHRATAGCECADSSTACAPLCRARRALDVSRTPWLSPHAPLRSTLSEDYKERITGANTLEELWARCKVCTPARLGCSLPRYAACAPCICCSLTTLAVERSTIRPGPAKLHDTNCTLRTGFPTAPWPQRRRQSIKSAR